LRVVFCFKFNESTAMNVFIFLVVLIVFVDSLIVRANVVISLG